MKKMRLQKGQIISLVAIILLTFVVAYSFIFPDERIIRYSSGSGNLCVDKAVTDCQTCEPTTGVVTNKPDNVSCSTPGIPSGGRCHSGTCVSPRCSVEGADLGCPVGSGNCCLSGETCFSNLAIGKGTTSLCCKSGQVPVAVTAWSKPVYYTCAPTSCVAPNSQECKSTCCKPKPNEYCLELEFSTSLGPNPTFGGFCSTKKNDCSNGLTACRNSKGKLGGCCNLSIETCSTGSAQTILDGKPITGDFALCEPKNCSSQGLETCPGKVMGLVEHSICCPVGKCYNEVGNGKPYCIS